jgi:hypothetical protein
MLLELACLLVRYHGSFRSAARWMVVLGALAGLPAAYAGAYAMSDVVRRSSATGASFEGSWHELERASSLSDAQWQMLGSHAWTSGGIAVIASVIVTIAVACTDRWRRRLYPVFLGLLLGCLGFMGFGAYQGGEMVYRTGLAVTLPQQRSEADADATTSPATTHAADDSPAAEAQTEQPTGVYYYVNPLQAHVTLAGVVAAVGMLALGLSLRAAATSPHWRDPELGRAGLAAQPNPQRGGTQDMAVLRSFSPRVEVTGAVEHIPAARIWLLVFLVAVCAALAGWWTLAHWYEMYRPKDLWDFVVMHGYARRRAHVLGAGTILALPLLMALLARFARRSRVAITLFGVFFVAVLAAQVWVGALMMFDQPKAPDGMKWYLLQDAAGTVAATTPATRASPAPPGLNSNRRSTSVPSRLPRPS